MEQSAQLLTSIIQTVVAQPALHAKWLNTLSMMENTGSRKISRFEHPVEVDIMILKHAAEEARHAYYLKKQIAKMEGERCPDYSFPYLLAPVASYQYLHHLDVSASRYLKKVLKLEGWAMRQAAYLLVTYAIEVRADMLYGIYQDALTAIGSKVNVKSIIKEEEGHLAEMTRMLKEFSPEWESIAADICQVEDELFHNWLRGLKVVLEQPVLA
jgi:hypothetical protein